MNAAPIQLTEYFITELHISANPKFDPKQEAPIRIKDYQVMVEALSNPEDHRDWKLILELQLQPPAEANIPYRLSAQMVGSAIIHPKYPKDRVERLVRTNGSSMLFGAMREVIRDSTARGPYSAVVIPSTSFYEPEEDSQGSPPSKPSSEPRATVDKPPD